MSEQKFNHDAENLEDAISGLDAKEMTIKLAPILLGLKSGNLTQSQAIELIPRMLTTIEMSTLAMMGINSMLETAGHNLRKK